MKLFRILLGALTGYLLSLATSIAWFALTQHEPTDTASTAYMATTTLVSVVLSVVCGYVATYIAASTSGSVGFALLLLVFSLGSIATTHTFAHPIWTLLVSICAMVPSALIGGLLRQPPQPA